MRQWLASLMLCVMLLSHGSMGAAIPHDHGRDAGHAHASDGMSVHHADEHRQEHIAPAGELPAEDGTDHAVHAHVVGDIARPATSVAARLTDDRLDGGVATALFRPSRGIAPLLEPPSA
ncbi:hypothetical protein CKY28_17185 [Sphingomonas lenta]|uniref:Cobalt transporter n=1 Tax=Sphingomonas lenta TaxID=1141887 RepID=A0A2A2SBB1_9SPHN|nr:hypothetical protein CKY28_17185 [Sphingomonas lenta]